MRYSSGRRIVKEVFKELKHYLVIVPVLMLPFETGGFVIYINASYKGLGCVLMQHGKVMLTPQDN